jgi:hypothetical protein
MGPLPALDKSEILARVYLHEAERYELYTREGLLIGQYLETLQRPDGLTNLQLRQKSKSFFVWDGYLYSISVEGGEGRRRVE